MGKYLRSGLFDSIWIQPAAGDAGGAIGAALTAYHHYFKQPRAVTKSDRQKGSYLGTQYSGSEIEQFLKLKNIPFTAFKNPSEMTEKVAELINTGKNHRMVSGSDGIRSACFRKSLYTWRCPFIRDAKKNESEDKIS